MGEQTTANRDRVKGGFKEMVRGLKGEFDDAVDRVREVADDVMASAPVQDGMRVARNGVEDGMEQMVSVALRTIRACGSPKLQASVQKLQEQHQREQARREKIALKLRLLRLRAGDNNEDERRAIAGELKLLDKPEWRRMLSSILGSITGSRRPQFVKEMATIGFDRLGTSLEELAQVYTVVERATVTVETLRTEAGLN